MPYYIRVLGKNNSSPSLSALQAAAKPALIETEPKQDREWTELVLKHYAGLEIAVIERNPVIEGALGADELQEFIDEVSHYEPSSAANWLRHYLPSVAVIYAFQLLSGTDVDSGWDRLHAVYNLIWNHAGGILQADGEGFSNEDGFTILWQFSDTVSGNWNMGILDGNGHWVHFEMDLGNPDHRAAFRRGEVPPGVKLLSVQP